MAGAALIFRYQWRAYWRRFSRAGRARFYFTVLALLAWLFLVKLPPSLSSAAQALAARETASMNDVLAGMCLLWLFVVAEDPNVSLSSRRLLRFPLDVRTLLKARILSLFCSPVVLMISFGSLLTLLPLIAAGHPLLGSLAALMLFAMTACVGMSVSQLWRVAEWRRGTLVLAAIVGMALGSFVVALGPLGVQQLRAGLTAVSPAHLVTAVAVADTSSALLTSLATLSVSAVASGYLLVWSFRRSLYRQPATRTARRGKTIVHLPGRLGGLAQKERRAFSSVLDLWLGLLLVLAACAVSLVASLSPAVRQSIVVIVCVLNANLTLNCLGLERPAGLNRYQIFPIRGRDLLLAKNAGLALLVGGQLLPLFVIGVWQSGPVQVGAEILAAMVLLLSHLAWGNIVSVFEPLKMHPYRFAPTGEPVVGILTILLGSVPGVGMLVLLRLESPMPRWAMAAIVLATAAAYFGSLQFAGRSFERRSQIISGRLA